MSQASVIFIDSKMKKLFALAQILPLGSWFVPTVFVGSTVSEFICEHQFL